MTDSIQSKIEKLLTTSTGPLSAKQIASRYHLKRNSVTAILQTMRRCSAAGEARPRIAVVLGQEHFYDWSTGADKTGDRTEKLKSQVAHYAFAMAHNDHPSAERALRRLLADFL